MSYIIRCCNCYFEMYLYEINQKAEIMDPSRQNVLSIMRIREKGQPKKRILAQWFNINGEVIFHSCFKCDYKVLQSFTLRKNSFILQILREHCYASNIDSMYDSSKDHQCCLENVNSYFDEDKYFNSNFFCYYWSV